MRRGHVRCVAALLLLCMLPLMSGCGGGVVELALTAQRLYGVWRLYKLYDDGTPSWISVASAVLKLGKAFDYSLEYVDAGGAPVETETGTWSVDSGVLVLNVDTSTIDPASEGNTLRLPARFTDRAGDELSITRRVTEGQVTIAQEQIYQREPPPD